MRGKSIVAVFMVITLLASLLSTSVFAETTEVDNGLAISSTKLLPRRDVMKIVDMNLQGYLSTDTQTQGKTLTASEDFIPLYDLHNNMFAYMVPLLENGKDIGYMTVGAIEDGYATYNILIEDNITSNILSELNETNASDTGSAQLVFIPPMQYILKREMNQSVQYFDITNIRQIHEVTNTIEKNQSVIQDAYKNIRNEENREHMRNLQQASPSYSTLAAKEDVSLYSERTYGNFVPIEYSNGVYSYGGNQNWWDSGSNQAERGCGPVAAANITNYLAKIKDSRKYGKLYSGNTWSLSDFMKHMNTLYDYINPGMFGEVSVSDFASKVERYAKDKGVTLSRVTDNSSFTLDNTATYIKAGLSIDSPVATLNTKKWSNYDYEWHWMTITKYYRDPNDNRWIAVSTWGKRHSIDYRVHFDAMKYGWWQGGLMYFE
ncbi:hypothetical protein NDS46_24690 [Paenibacillus thiaminolyticus]|uniref:hypothetical protein n=1 Tax=Paenibacillus thiaminolyticus TaxID=49283 RepID=UPI00232DA4CE|nr:hypothetical protein [Paenibacillus thiaminolyticus]WCF07475.1 hypothetical protein NDS46_24690 [Paenibacillus thiaminolyticus]